MVPRGFGPMGNGMLAPDKIARLKALLAGLPEGMAGRLAQASGDPLISALLGDITAEDDAARARFFAPVAPLSGDPALTRPSRAQAPPSLIAGLWAWLKSDLDPVAAGIARKGPDAALDEARAAGAAAILIALEADEDDPRAGRLIRRRLGVSDFGAVRDVCAILRGAGPLSEALKGIPDRIETIGPSMAEELSGRYEALCEAAPDAAPWFFHMVMARMEAPWRLLRVFERLSLRRDDLLLAGTDLNTVGEALLEDASWWLDGFADPPQTAEDAMSAAAALRRFAEATAGMAREIGIRKDGPWGRQLVALRARASAQMDEIHASAIRVLDVVAPDPRRPAPRWRLMTVEDGEAPAARLRALCRFLILARDDAGRAAAAGAHADVLAAIQRRIDLTADSLLEGVRRGQAPKDARKRLNDLAGFLVELDDAEGADLLLRRTAAAGAA